MARFVLRYRGKGAIAACDLERIRATGAAIIEDGARMLLVEGVERALRDALGADDWVVAAEVTYGVPETKKSIR